MTGMLCLPPSRKREQRDRFSISAAARVKSISGLGSSAKQQDRLTNFSSEGGFKSCACRRIAGSGHSNGLQRVMT